MLHFRSFSMLFMISFLIQFQIWFNSLYFTIFSSLLLTWALFRMLFAKFRFHNLHTQQNYSLPLKQVKRLLKSTWDHKHGVPSSPHEDSHQTVFENQLFSARRVVSTMSENEKMCSRAPCFRRRVQKLQQQNADKYFSLLGEAKYFQSGSDNDSLSLSLSRVAEQKKIK